MKIPVIMLAEAERQAALIRRDLEAQRQVVAYMQALGFDTERSASALRALEEFQQLNDFEIQRARMALAILPPAGNRSRP